MKKIKLLLLIGLLLSLSSYGQGDPSHLDPGLLETILETTIEADKQMAVPSVRNQVYLEQIGNRNFSNSIISATESNVALTQHGDDNFINFFTRANTVFGSVLQDGNNNRYFNFVDDLSENVSLNIQQNGNSGHFAQFGSNSIGNSLQFEMNGDFKSITVRNFK